MLNPNVSKQFLKGIPTVSRLPTPAYLITKRPSRTNDNVKRWKRSCTLHNRSRVANRPSSTDRRNFPTCPPKIHRFTRSKAIAATKFHREGRNDDAGAFTSSPMERGECCCCSLVVSRFVGVLFFFQSEDCGGLRKSFRPDPVRWRRSAFCCGSMVWRLFCDVMRLS